jgi:hypothetical protein
MMALTEKRDMLGAMIAVLVDSTLRYVAFGRGAATELLSKPRMWSIAVSALDVRVLRESRWKDFNRDGP